MGLRDYKVATKKVTLDDGQVLVVRGLGVDAIMALVRGQGDVMRRLYEKAAEGKLTAEDTEELLGVLLDEAPILVCLIIAFGCGEEEDFGYVLNLPIYSQVELLEAIITLTFTNEGGAKKVMETIIRAVKSAAALQSPAA